jgi:DNA polymerase (family 10)
VLALDSDAHNLRELEYVRWCVAQARRAWVEPAVVIHTWPRARLLEWVAGKPARVAAASRAAG